MIRTFTGLQDMNGVNIFTGDILCIDCNMICDYTGKTSTDIQELVIVYDEIGKRFTCYDKSLKHRLPSCLWSHIPNKKGYINL